MSHRSLASLLVSFCLACIPTEAPCSATCSGCCDAADVCHRGDDARTCGSGGAQCLACGASDRCQLGRCLPGLTGPSEPAIDAGTVGDAGEAADAGATHGDAGEAADAGSLVVDAGSIDAGPRPGDGGVDAGAVNPSAPRILSLTVVPARLYRNDPGASTFSALVTDIDGLSDVVGGRLVDPISGGTYGVFTASGASGAYTFSLTWLGMQAIRGVDASPLGGSERWFRAEFFDVAGRIGSADVPVLIDCGLSGYGVCQNACVPMRTSLTNCGTCGVTVTAPRLCEEGTVTCPGYAPTYCSASNECVNLATSPNHCGACGRPVPNGQTCISGAPSCAGPSETHCPAQGVCADLSSDARHCGACGVPVTAPRVCLNGAPACTRPNETYCAAQNVCADLSSSASHCGACGVSVGAPRTCVAGVPRCPASGETYCQAANVCVDLMTSAAHCGQCGNALSPGSGATCVNGVRTCGSGRTWCAQQGVCSTSPACDLPLWRPITSPSLPAARVGHAMAYDSLRQRLVLFGGAVGPSRTLSNETWEFDGTTWLQRLPPTSPSARDDHAMAFDPVRGRVVLFGGSVVGDPSTSETWEWDGTTWTQRLMTGSRPGDRRGHAMTWDAARSRVLLFGGAVTATYTRDDTWEWDGSTWTQKVPLTSPPPRTDHGLAYSTASGRVLLVGGWNEYSYLLADTWEWNGTTWAQLSPTTSPSADRAQLVELPSRGRLVLFRTPYGGTTTETWEWTGSRWERAALFGPTPSVRFGAGLTTFGTGTSSRVMLFGGDWTGAPLQDFWSFSL